MILGHGIDIVNLDRFDLMDSTRLQRLAKRICTDTELVEFQNCKYPKTYLAKIWASKEAISKAFGTGIKDNVTWQNMQIDKTDQGKPIVQFKEIIAGPICHLSISHDKNILIASAILEIYAH